MREGEVPPEPAVAADVPGDRRPVVTHRVERPPSGLKTGCWTAPEWPRSVSRRVADSASQSATVPSRLVETTVPPSGLKSSQLGPRRARRPPSAPLRCACRPAGCPGRRRRQSCPVRAQRERMLTRADRKPPGRPAAPEVPPYELAFVRRDDDRAAVGHERETGRFKVGTDVGADEASGSIGDRSPPGWRRPAH